jgi:hypothetical protein
VLAGLVAGAGGAARADASVTQYRSTLNAYCRSITPKLRTAVKGMAAAEKSNDLASLVTYLGQDLGYSHLELQTIRSTQVPAALRSRMAPAIRTAEQLDGLIQDTATLFATAHTLTQTQFTTRFTTLTAKIDRLHAPFNHELDAAGLKDCGSNQS